MSLAHHFEWLTEQLAPPGAAVVTLTGGCLLLLTGWLLGPGSGSYDPTILGKEVGFLSAPNWFIVYMLLFPPYAVIFALVVSDSKVFFSESSDAQETRLVTGPDGAALAPGAVLAKWNSHLQRWLTIPLYVLLLGVIYSSILQWGKGCLMIFWRSELPAYQPNEAHVNDILKTEVIDWSTVIYISPHSSYVQKIVTLSFSSVAYIYMAIALFIYLGIFAYYACLCWFIMRLTNGQADLGTRMFVRGLQPFSYFGKIFNYMYIATVLGLGAGYCMSLQAQYLNSADLSIFGFAFRDARCLVSAFSESKFSDCAASHIARQTASSFMSYFEAIYTISLFATSVTLLWWAFELVQSYYLRKIGDPIWQRAVGIKYVENFIQYLESVTFTDAIAPYYIHLIIPLIVMAIAIVFPQCGTIYLISFLYALTFSLRNQGRGPGVTPTKDSKYASTFAKTQISREDRDEIILLLNFQDSASDFGPFLADAIDGANIPPRYKDHLKTQIRTQGTSDPAKTIVEISLEYEPIEAEKSTVLGNILVALSERIGLDFSCFIATKAENCGLVRDHEMLGSLNLACVRWNDAMTK